MARSQVLQMCEEVASRVERAARRLRPPAWFRAAAASPRGFLLAARRPSRLPPWPLPAIEQPTTATTQHSHSGSRSAPATLTRRRDRDRHRGSDAAEEETWSRDAATLYATPLSSRRHGPQPDWQTTPLGSWDSTPPRRHRSQLTLRTASPAPAASSDAGWSQEARRPYLGWRSLERLSRRPWTPEERLAASLLERSGRSTPTSTKDAADPKKQSSGTQQHQPSGADASRERTAVSSLRQESAPKSSQERTTVSSTRKASTPNASRGGTATSSLRKESVPNASRESTAGSSFRKESGPNALRETTTVSSLRKESESLPTPPIVSARTEHTTHYRNQVEEPSTTSMQLTTLSFLVNERNREAENTSSPGKKSTGLDEMSTGSLASRPAEEDSSQKRQSENDIFQRLEQETLPYVRGHPEVHGLKTSQHNGLLLSTQIKTFPLRRTDHDVNLSHASHNNQPTDTQNFPLPEGDTLGRTLYREKSPVKLTDRASRDTKEEKTTMKPQYLNGPSQLPTQLKALSVTTHYINDDGGMSANADDKHFPARDLLARSYDASNIPTSANAISEPTVCNGDDHYRTTNHLNSSPSLQDCNFTTDQSPAYDGGDRAKRLPTVELRTRSFEVTLPQRVTTSDTSRKLSIQEQFWVAEDRAPSAVQDDPSLVIMPLVKKTATAPPATHISSTSSSTANRKSAPTFPISSSISASPSAATDNKTLPYQMQFDYTSDTTSPAANGPKPFDISHLRSVELRTRSVEIPLPQINSVITDAGSNLSPSVDAKNPSVPNFKEGSPQSSATTRAMSMPPVPRDRTFIIESPTLLHKRSPTFSPLPAVEFQSPSSDVILLPEVSTVAAAKPNSHRQEADPIPSRPSQRHSLPTSPLVETSLTTIRVSPSPEVVDYQSVYSGSSPLLGRKPFTIKHVEAPGGHRTNSSAKNTKSREISLLPALPKPFEPMQIPHSKIPVPTASKPFTEKETAMTSETSHEAINHLHPSDRAQKSSLPVTPVIRRPSYRVATRNELNPTTRKKRPAAGVNFAEVLVSTSVASPAENSRTKAAPIAKPPRLRTKNNATSTPKQSPRQKQPTSTLPTQRSGNVVPIPHDTELHLPNGVSPLPYSALRILDSQLPQNSTGPANAMSVSLKHPVSSESGAATTKVTVSKQSMFALQHVPDPTLLTPLRYKPCTTTDL